MGLLDRIKGLLTDEPRTGTSATARSDQRYDQRYDSVGVPRAAARTEDEAAVERYRYLLRTASPDAVEEAHAEAFAKLTPQQRRMVFEELSRDAAPADRPAADDPRTLARSATRSEVRQPGFLERSFGSGRGAGLGTVIGGSLLGTVAGVVIGSAIADLVLPGIGDLAADFGGGVEDLGQDVSDGFDFADLGGGDF